MRFTDSQGITPPVSEAPYWPASESALPSTPLPRTSQIPAVFVTARADLVDDAIEQAKAGGYTLYTTTLRAAWEAAIDSINESLDHYMSVSPRHDLRILADRDYRIDERFEGLRKVAQFHRSLGVTLQMYIGLFKMFRDLYTEHHDRLHEPDDSCPITPAAKAQTSDHKLLKLFFDEAEISMMASWNETSESVRRQELQRKALSASLEKDTYLAIFESLRDPAFLLDHDRALINANQMANALFRAKASPGDIYYKHDQQHLTLQRVVELACNAARHRFNPGLSPIAGHDRLGAVDHLWLETLHGERCFDIRERKIQDACDNKPVSYVVILHDVTSHRQATEQALKAEQEKSTFLATMSHEVRTPMHAILGATDLLRHADRNKRNEYIDTIEATGQHLLETLTKVLDYSRLESGKQPINSTRNDLVAFIDKLEKFASTWARQAQRTLCVVEQPDLPEHAVFDTGCTRQILYNLIANAIAHGEGLITLAINHASPDSSTGGSLIFDVSDQGRQLANTNLNQLFEPFYRGHSNINGTGLGLAICRHLAESMSGSIEAQTCASFSTTRFRLQLPLIAAVSAQTDFSLAGTFDDQQLPEGSVMLVDDDPISARITADQLLSLGMQVDKFHSAGECLHALKQDGVNHRPITWWYFVVDYQLPESNGAMLARRIRSMVGTQAVRIVALTANTQLAQGEDGKAFDLILTKPASALDLVQALFNEHHRRPDTTDNDLSRHPFRGLPAASVHTIVQTFLNDWAEKLPGFFADLETMIKPDSVRQQAHRLASSASSVGLMEITDELRQLDSELSRQSVVSSGQYWLDRLETPMRRAPIKVREAAECSISDSMHGRNERDPA